MSLVEKALRKLQRSAPVIVPPVPASCGAAGRVIPVDSAALRAAGLMPPEQEERLIGQQFRHIKRPLIAGAFGRGGPRLPNGSLIMVASAVPGEGKTFTAVNLALSMSLEKDLRVVLVDADVPKPQVSRAFGLDAAPGLLDVLRNPRLDPESVVVHTEIANLSVMPAGTASNDSTELLASARMEQIVRSLAQHDGQRIVLFDSPPLLHTTESHALIPACGQVVVVVRAGTTPQHVLMEALSHLMKHSAVSLVLNASALAAHSAHYYSGYGARNTLPPTKSA